MVKQTATALTALGATASVGSRYVFNSDSGDSLRKSFSVLDEMPIGAVSEEVYGTPTTLLGADSSMVDAGSIPDNLISFNLASVSDKPAEVQPPAPKPVAAKPAAPKPTTKVVKKAVAAKPKVLPKKLTFHFHRWLDHSFWKKDRPSWSLRVGAGSHYFVTNIADTKFLTDTFRWYKWDYSMNLTCEESGRDYRCQNPKTQKQFTLRFVSDSYNF